MKPQQRIQQKKGRKKLWRTNWK